MLKLSRPRCGLSFRPIGAWLREGCGTCSRPLGGCTDLLPLAALLLPGLLAIYSGMGSVSDRLSSVGRAMAARLFILYAISAVPPLTWLGLSPRGRAGLRVSRSLGRARGARHPRPSPCSDGKPAVTIRHPARGGHPATASRCSRCWFRERRLRRVITYLGPRQVIPADRAPPRPTRSSAGGSPMCARRSPARRKGHELTARSSDPRPNAFGRAPPTPPCKGGDTGQG